MSTHRKALLVMSDRPIVRLDYHEKIDESSRFVTIVGRDGIDARNEVYKSILTKMGLVHTFTDDVRITDCSWVDVLDEGETIKLHEFVSSKFPPGSPTLDLDRFAEGE